MRAFDLHADTMLDISNHVGKGEKGVLEKYHLPDYRAGEIGAQIFALYVPLLEKDWKDYSGEEMVSPQNVMMNMLARCFKEFRDCDEVEMAYSGSDIERIADSGKFPVLLGIEGFYGFNGEPGMIDVMYDMGFRHGMMTWNDDNEFASGAEFTGEDKGLTDLGIYTVKRMEELGMLVDVSHLSFRSFWDVMENTKGIVIASHSNAYSLCPSPRNLKDDQIRAIADRGGVIGMNSWKGFIMEDMEKATELDLARHARYIADLTGPEYVACGFDYCDYFSDEDPLPGLRGAAETQNFIRALSEVGFSDREVEMIAWDNAMRVIKAVLG